MKLMTLLTEGWSSGGYSRGDRVKFNGADGKVHNGTIESFLRDSTQPLSVRCDDSKKLFAVALKKDDQPGAPYIVKESVNEAQVDTPGEVMKKAQLAKVRADMKQLGSKQKTLAQSKKNIKDTPTKRRLTKQMADIGVKKADLGIRAAEMSKQIKGVNEANISWKTKLDTDTEDAIMIIAKNERKFYDKKDAKGAIEFAINEYIKERMWDLKSDLSSAKSELVKMLADYWKREGR